MKKYADSDFDSNKNNTSSNYLVLFDENYHNFWTNFGITVFNRTDTSKSRTKNYSNLTFIIMHQQSRQQSGCRGHASHSSSTV